MVIDKLTEFFNTFIYIVASSPINSINLNNSTSRSLLFYYKFNL